jgi:hypothetical protein
MVVVVLKVGRSGCSLKVIIVVSYRWGSESEAFAFQSRTAAATHICSCTCYIGSCVENSATDVSSRIRDLMVQIAHKVYDEMPQPICRIMGGSVVFMTQVLQRNESI